MISELNKQMLWNSSKLLRVLYKIRMLPKLVSLSSYLNNIGWFESCFATVPVDKRFNPLPWYTYSSINFLERRLTKEMIVFEYGSGNSTLWWSNRVSKVISCEHDKQWFNYLSPKLHSNTEYLYFQLLPEGQYSEAVKNYDTIFDLIVIDGRDRVNCVKNSLSALKPDGVVVLDNSDREKYQEAYSYLLERSFRVIDFSGPGPSSLNGWCTSIFYRRNNCLFI